MFPPPLGQESPTRRCERRVFARWQSSLRAQRAEGPRRKFVFLARNKGRKFIVFDTNPSVSPSATKGGRRTPGRCMRVSGMNLRTRHNHQTVTTYIYPSTVLLLVFVTNTDVPISILEKVRFVVLNITTKIVGLRATCRRSCRTQTASAPS
jgi:hypothetical protein